VVIGDVVVQEAGDMGTLLNVVVKEKSHHKYYKKPEPYLEGVKIAFRKLAEIIKKENLAEVAVSYMCSGTERLHRLFTMDLLYSELKDVPVKVHYYGKFPSKRWHGAGNLFRGAADVIELQQAPEAAVAAAPQGDPLSAERMRTRASTASQANFAK
jgi:hypothetical protein